MSALVPIAVFIDLYDPKTNGIEERFQNADPVNAISFTSPIPSFGTDFYKYLSFLYSGATQSKSGDNLEASLILANTSTLRDGSTAPNKLSMNYAHDAVDKGWNVHIHTCKMNTAFTTVEDIISTDSWSITSMGYDTTNIELMLSTGVDAVGGNIGRYLTSALVGHLPVTGNIRAK
tara:strand:+ start:623 stop:1150 length:528 start_codon:yes stop_codon:yes gene_type:complete